MNIGLPGNTAADALSGRDVPITEALYLATMALAFEQRTANLIAMDRHYNEAFLRDALTDQGTEDWKAVGKQIEARMGIR
jgi:hypothetical protein